MFPILFKIINEIINKNSIGYFIEREIREEILYPIKDEPLGITPPTQK